MSLSGKMTELADNFRNYFNVKDKLTLDDMIKLLYKPTYPILLENGSFIFSSDFNGTAQTDNGGTTILNTVYIAPVYYSNEKALLDDPKTRPDLTLRLHLNITATSGATISWGINGAGGAISFVPKVGNIVSDWKLATGLMVDHNNGLVFMTQDTTKVDLTKSYVEIIM